MGRSQETFNKKEVRKKKEKKRKAKEERRQARKENEKNNSLDDMIAYVDENGQITSTPPDPTEKEEIDPDEIQVSTPKKEEIEEPETVRTGFVTYFNENKGFGFIKDSKTQESVFVHVNNLLEEVIKGNKVSFEVEMGPKGPNAVKVKLEK